MKRFLFGGRRSGRGNHTRERKISYIIKRYTLRIDWIIVLGFSSEIIKIKWFYKFAILNQFN